MCRRCGDPLRSDNKSGFCRNCQREHKLGWLRRKHPEPEPIPTRNFFKEQLLTR